MQLLIALIHAHVKLGVMQIEGSVKLPMKKGFGKTDRSDDWWKGPTAMAAYLGFMIIYATWRGFMESDFLFFSEFGASSCDNWDSAKSFKDVSECQTMSCLLYTSPSPRD